MQVQITTQQEFTTYYELLKWIVAADQMNRNTIPKLWEYIDSDLLELIEEFKEYDQVAKDLQAGYCVLENDGAFVKFKPRDLKRPRDVNQLLELAYLEEYKVALILAEDLSVV